MCDFFDLKWTLLCLLFVLVQMIVVTLLVFYPQILAPFAAVFNMVLGLVINVLKGIASLFGSTTPSSDTSTATSILPASTSISSFVSSILISSSSDAGIPSLQTDPESSSSGVYDEHSDVTTESDPEPIKRPSDLPLELQRELSEQRPLKEFDHAQLAQTLSRSTARPLLIPTARSDPPPTPQSEADTTTEPRLTVTEPDAMVAQAQSIASALSQLIPSEQLQEKASDQSQPASDAQPAPISSAQSSLTSAAKLELVVTAPPAPILVVKSKIVPKRQQQRAVVPCRLPVTTRPQVQHMVTIAQIHAEPAAQSESTTVPQQPLAVEHVDAAQAQRSPAPESIKTRPRLETQPPTEEITFLTEQVASAAQPVDEPQPGPSALAQARRTVRRRIRSAPTSVSRPQPVSPPQPRSTTRLQRPLATQYLPEPDIELETEYRRLQCQRRYQRCNRSRTDFILPSFRRREPAANEVTIDLCDFRFIVSVRDLYSVERAYRCRLIGRTEFEFYLVQRKMRNRYYWDFVIVETSGIFYNPDCRKYVTEAEVHRANDTDSSGNEESSDESE
ncbi:unnamed protein product [Colias eurytheme]|nr:unnamed protein product [Colias eurytheme]